MRTEDFQYHLPKELIAQRPPEERDGGRLMVLAHGEEGAAHYQIRSLPDLLPQGCLLVVNDSKVIPARLSARRSSGGKVEVLLIRREEAEDAHAPTGGGVVWSGMVRASKRLRQDEELELLDAQGAPAGCPPITVLERPEGGRARVLIPDEEAALGQGAIPLPPYITRPADQQDSLRYQTVYARQDGSVAAPTAGLHFTDEMLARIEELDMEVARVTLHVGPGTFTPVRTDRVEDHHMESEAFDVPRSTAEAIARARAEGRPVVAVGTTVVRTLETSRGEAGRGSSELFIHPGHTFSVVDALLTNFHLPGSTLMMLVAALAGKTRLLAAYEEAVERGYRFYSYGDAMLVL